MSGNRWNCNGRVSPAGCGNGWNNNPYYNGPCPNADGDYAARGEHFDEERRFAPDCCCQRRGERPPRARVMGRFASPSPLSVIAGAPVPLVACGDPCGVDCMGGAVQFKSDGVYVATLTATVPAGEALTTTLMPTLNGVMLPAGMVEVGGEVARAVSGFSGQIVFCANSCDRFALTTSEALSVPASGTPLLTMELTRIGE